MWKSAGRARLCEFYPGIWLITEEKARKPLSQGKKNLSQSTVYILPRHPHITKPTQTHKLQNPQIHTHTHTHTLQNNIKPTVQIKTNTVQDTPKGTGERQGNIYSKQSVASQKIWIFSISNLPFRSEIYITIFSIYTQ